MAPDFTVWSLAGDSDDGPYLCRGASCPQDHEGCKQLYLLRHAEGQHQVANNEARQSSAVREAIRHMDISLQPSEAARERRRWENWPVHWENPAANKLIDAVLTENGRVQCLRSRSSMPAVELVVVSPFRRTLETANLLFGSLRTGNVSHQRFVVHDLCRERFGEFTCDKRHAMTENFKWRLSASTDLEHHHATSHWSTWDWTTQISLPTARPADTHYTNEDRLWQPSRESSLHVQQRVTALLLWLLSRPERSFAIVSHSSFLKHMLKTIETPRNAELLGATLCNSSMSSFLTVENESPKITQSCHAIMNSVLVVLLLAALRRRRWHP
eukprot:TRINITY_DN79850_c0_g1_i1.p1 TRINITY_DN79850_c0_g1~~TRINITY_DN79850_c0_g1_i1.p1  ORF type:complete len:343 (+),score=45.57 TRINITY_DN79850_c0_g1_i1:48-1031(+)